MEKQRQRFSIEELQKLDKETLLIKIREIVPDPMEVTLFPEEIRVLKMLSETEKIRAQHDHKDQEALRWQGVLNDLTVVAQGRPYQRSLY